MTIFFKTMRVWFLLLLMAMRAQAAEEPLWLNSAVVIDVPQLRIFNNRPLDKLHSIVTTNPSQGWVVSSQFSVRVFRAPAMPPVLENLQSLIAAHRSAGWKVWLTPSSYASASSGFVDDQMIGIQLKVDQFDVQLSPEDAITISGTLTICDVVDDAIAQSIRAKPDSVILKEKDIIEQNIPFKETVAHQQPLVIKYSWRGGPPLEARIFVSPFVKPAPFKRPDP